MQQIYIPGMVDLWDPLGEAIPCGCGWCGHTRISSLTAMREEPRWEKQVFSKKKEKKRRGDHNPARHRE